MQAVTGGHFTVHGAVDDLFFLISSSDVASGLTGRGEMEHITYDEIRNALLAEYGYCGLIVRIEGTIRPIEHSRKKRADRVLRCFF